MVWHGLSGLLDYRAASNLPVNGGPDKVVGSNLNQWVSEHIYMLVDTHTHTFNLI